MAKALENKVMKIKSIKPKLREQMNLQTADEREKLLETTVRIINEVFNADILDKTRVGNNPDARKAFSLICWYSFGMKKKEISRFLKMNHASIISQIREGEIFLEVDPNFKKLFDKCENRITEADQKELIKSQIEYHKRRAKEYEALLAAC